MMKKILFVALSLGLAACAQKIPLEATDNVVPQEWQYAEQEQVWPELDWWEQVQSQELLSLQQLAKKQNTEHAAMAARLLQADYQLKIRGVSKLPTVHASLGESHNSRFSGGGVSQGFSADVGASYEL